MWEVDILIVSCFSSKFSSPNPYMGLRFKLRISSAWFQYESNADGLDSRLKRGKASSQFGTSNGDTELLRDSNQPFIYDIRFSKKKFTLELYDTSNPNQHWSTLQPNVVVLAFDISNRETLAGLSGVILLSITMPVAVFSNREHII